MSTNEIGNKYGRYTIVDKDTDIIWKSPKGKTVRLHRWICRCDCGNIRSVRIGTLKNGTSKSCGCSWILSSGEASFNLIMNKMMWTANKRNIEWKLTKKQFKDITSKSCFYCQARPKNENKEHNKLNGKYLYSGIDRVDNTKGYIKGNCVPCCWNCNRAKQSLDLFDFKEWIVKVYIHWASH